MEQRPRVLLVEPNVLLAKQLYSILSEQFEVIAVRSAQAAVIAADKSKPHLIITELQTADASLSGFLHELRSYAEWRDIPVVLYTFSLQLPPSVKQILKERFNVTLVLHKSHITAPALLGHLQKIFPQTARATSHAVTDVHDPSESAAKSHTSA